MLSRRRTLSVAAALAVTAGLGVAGSSAVAGDEAAAPVAAPTSPAATAPAPIGAVQPDQAETLQALRRPQRASDAIPADVAAAAASPAKFGRNPDLARAISTPTGKGWIVPGDDTVCVVVPDPVDGYGTSCSPTDTVAATGLTLTMVGKDATKAVTVVPDGAEVVATEPDGDRRALRPDASGVVAVSDAQADKVTVVTDEARRSTPLPSADEVAEGVR
ncbi:hypothetical protein [Patulibacter sp. SYSU D01012]|uniref:hypothetical protein n=1 Tax=Patulibacter sp. SYSU D01012 TaxID=2817381 RepID=UPI001B314311|nr:hypothetical protein [Patulibacter sp. SYSU D01012]